MRQIGSIFSALLISLSVGAQTVVWQAQPTDFSEISRIGTNLYKVVRNNKIGLINADGNIVAKIENDNIGGCYEHKALLTSNDGYGERITGCLTDDGRFYGYTKKIYTLNGQKFFSDGLLSVSDESGNLGYIDVNGNDVVGFKGEYTRIKPFTEGYAAVRKNGKYILIDKNGNVQKFLYGGNGVGAAIGGCTNVHNGIAYVYDEYGGSDRTYFEYNAREKSRLKKVGKIKDTSMDYLFCYQSVTGRAKAVPFTEMRVLGGTKGLAPTSVSGMYGYENNGSVVLPEQFTSATAFEDGYAIVTLNGQMGILKYIEGSSFSSSTSDGKHNFYSGNRVTCKFNIFVPGVWRTKSMDVVLKDAEGVRVNFSKIATDNYSFEVTPKSTCKKEYTVVVYGEGLKLYEGKLAYSFNKMCATCSKDIENCPYNGNHPAVKHDKPKDKKQEKKSKEVCPYPECGKTYDKCEYQFKH